MRCIKCGDLLKEEGQATGMGFVYFYFCPNTECERYKLYVHPGTLKDES